MIRAAAKNFLRVAAVVEPADYAGLAEGLTTHGGRLDLATRFTLARKALAHTAQYDAAISQFLACQDPASLRILYDLHDRNDASAIGRTTEERP
jgi:phosphoribosylaminoimidazolecarboxamide formyltransferase/IMP cyclohydrolase